MKRTLPFLLALLMLLSACASKPADDAKLEDTRITSPEAIYSILVKPRKLDTAQEQILLVWYMDIAGLLAQEKKEQSGHLNHTLHIISDLHDLHLRLMQQQELGEDYRSRYALLAQHLPSLRARLGKESEMSDTELCFRALYAAMLYRI